jgi:hypothetical protein
MLAPVTDLARMILRLELEPDAEPIAGRLSGESGPAVAFIGWVGLAAAIEQALGLGRRAGEENEGEDSRNLGADPS